MTDWHTIRVPEDAYHEAKEAKEANGRTWGEQLTHGDDPDADLDDILARLDDLENELPRRIAAELRG